MRWVNVVCPAFWGTCFPDEGNWSVRRTWAGECISLGCGDACHIPMMVIATKDNDANFATGHDHSFIEDDRGATMDLARAIFNI